MKTIIIFLIVGISISCDGVIGFQEGCSVEQIQTFLSSLNIELLGTGVDRLRNECSLSQEYRIPWRFLGEETMEIDGKTYIIKWDKIYDPDILVESTDGFSSVPKLVGKMLWDYPVLWEKKLEHEKLAIEAHYSRENLVGIITESVPTPEQVATARAGVETINTIYIDINSGNTTISSVNPLTPDIISYNFLTTPKGIEDCPAAQIFALNENTIILDDKCDPDATTMWTFSEGRFFSTTYKKQGESYVSGVKALRDAEGNLYIQNIFRYVYREESSVWTNPQYYQNIAHPFPELEFLTSHTISDGDLIVNRKNIDWEHYNFDPIEYIKDQYVESEHTSNSNRRGSRFEVLTPAGI